MIIFNYHVYCTLRCPEGAPLRPRFRSRPLSRRAVWRPRAPRVPRRCGAQVQLCHRGFPPGGEGGRQVSLTTLPPSSLGRCWPGLRYHITDGEEPSGLFRVSRPPQGEEGGRHTAPLPSSHPPLPPAASFAHCPLEPPRVAIDTPPGAQPQLPGHRSARKLSLPARTGFPPSRCPKHLPVTPQSCWS